MPLRLNTTTLLAKIEGTYGQDANPTGASNAILLRGKPTLTPMQMDEVSRDLLLPYMGNAETLPGTVFGKLDFEVEAAGSGAAGTAPAHSPLLRACALSENILAAPVTATAQVGGSTTTIKLAAAASAVNDFYNGCPISITGGTGSGQSGLIVDYDGTSKIATVVSAAWAAPDATSQYSIGASVVYRPVSGSFEAVTLYFNLDGVLHKFLGARGNVSLDFAARKSPGFKFGLMGLFQSVADAAAPTATLTGWKKPLVCTKVNTPLFVLHDYASSALESLSLDLGVATSHYSLINASEQVSVDARAPKGKLSIEANTVATKDWFGTCRNLTTGTLGLQHGTAAGNKLALTAAALRLSNPAYGAINNYATLGMDHAALPVTGNDEFAISFF